MSGVLSLNGPDWRFKAFYGEDWDWRQSHLADTRDVRWWQRGSVPGSPLHDLWQLGEIPNPYYERNTLLCEWVSQRTWLYKKSFFAGEDLQGRRIQLHFKGVDFESRFYLNGEYLGRHVGMYTPAIFEVAGRLLYGAENMLSVVIEPAPFEQPQVGYTSRVHTHKSRMTYWWDFCPRLVHQGIWDDVYLDISGPLRCQDLFVRPRLSPGREAAELLVTAELDALFPVDAEIEASLRFQGEILATFHRGCQLEAGCTPLEFQMSVSLPHLWWPNGYGQQPLYDLEVLVRANGQTSHKQVVPFGIRQIETIPNQDASPAALPYTLVVNGRKIYIKGWNWVPLDVLYGVPRPGKLAHLLCLAQRANVNMLRVWGGGLIEVEAFYQGCDRAGILVWQEFIQSSSGIDNQPSSTPEFLDMLAGEAAQIIPQKRNHPALALWCGGNELQSDSGQPLDDSHPALQVLKTKVSRLDPDRLWLPTSPSGPVFGNSLDNIARDPAALHDVHGPWEYQGATGQYSLYNQGTCLLHSEFGVEGLTNLKTLHATIAPQHQWPVSLDSNPYWWHLGAWWVRRMVWDRLFGELPDVPRYVQATQFTQFEGLRYAVEADRRRKYHNSGTLPWQFNEPYPMAACTSAVDYYGFPKPAYYGVAAAYQPLHLSLVYPTLVWADRPEFQAQVWVCNSHQRPYQGVSMRIRLVDLAGNVHSQESAQVSFGENCARQLFEYHHPLAGITAVFFLDVQLVDQDAETLAGNRYVFSGSNNLVPLLDCPPTTIKVAETRHGDNWEVAITNTGQVAAMFLWLEANRAPGAAGCAYFSDNYFCLFPGESRSLTVSWRDVPETERSLHIKGWNTDGA